MPFAANLSFWDAFSVVGGPKSGFGMAFVANLAFWVLEGVSGPQNGFEDRISKR